MGSIRELHCKGHQTILDRHTHEGYEEVHSKQGTKEARQQARKQEGSKEAGRKQGSKEARKEGSKQGSKEGRKQGSTEAKKERRKEAFLTATTGPNGRKLGTSGSTGLDSPAMTCNTTLSIHDQSARLGIEDD